jgi:hypothetical protein
MLPFGFMFFEQVYRIDPDGKRAHLRKLAPRMPRTIQRIDVAPDGGLIQISQYSSIAQQYPGQTQQSLEQQPIPVDRLVGYVNELEGGNWIGHSVLRSCYKNWLIKDRLLRVQAQTIERNGMGVPLYKAQDGASEADMAAGKAMAMAWRAGEAAGSAVPFGADMKLVGVEGTLPDADPAIRYHDEQIARGVLAHFLNLGTQTGSWALGSTFADFFVLSLQTLAQQIADTVTQHVIEDLVDINFGEQEPAPRLVFDEIGSRQSATADALKSLVDAGILHPDQILEGAARQQYGLPPASPETAFPPPPTTPGGGGPPVTSEPGPGPSPEPPTTAPEFTMPPPGLQAGAGHPKEHAAVAAKFNPAEPRRPDGKWGSGGGAASHALKDALNLGDKTNLQPGEKLLGSSKIDGDAGGIRMALTERDGHRMLRLGLGGEDYGKRNRGEGIPAWDGNPSPPALSKAQREHLNAESDALDEEYDSASPDRQGAITARQDAIREQLATDDRGFNGTAQLDDYGMRRLADLIRPALADAAEQDKRQNDAWDEIDALEAKGNPDPARMERLREIARADATDYLTFAKGIVPGSAWGDVHFSVELDDPSIGPYVKLGVQPKGAPDDWGTGLDWQGRFDAAETKKFLRLLGQYAGVSAAAGHDTTPGHDQLHHYWTRGEGLAKWSASPTPWTTLYHHLLKYLPEGEAKRAASAWFQEVFGFASGSDLNRVTHGHPPRGHVVGPG